jgi:hypothetical protein
VMKMRVLMQLAVQETPLATWVKPAVAKTLMTMMAAVDLAAEMRATIAAQATRMGRPMR